VRLNYTSENLSYYLHTLACHGGEYMLHLKSLGKWMNEGVEHHHKLSWRLMDRSFRGGAAGNPYSVKTEDGKFVKDQGPVYKHECKDMSESLLEEQSRLMYVEFSPTWDPTLWEHWKLEKPVDFKSLKCQAPQVMAKEATHRAREAVARELKTRNHLQSLDDRASPWAREDAARRVELAAACSKRAIEKEAVRINICKDADLIKRLTKDCEGNVLKVQALVDDEMEE